MVERSGDEGQFIRLPSGADLNNVRKTGDYSVFNPTNGPSAGSFFVEVHSSPVNGVAHTTQMATNVETGAVYRRTKSGPWDDWTEVGGSGSGGGAYWSLPATALTAPSFIDPALGFQFNLTGVTGQIFRILPGVSGQRISLTSTTDWPSGSAVRMNIGTGQYALRDKYGNVIEGFDIDVNGDCVLLEYRINQVNNGAWHIVSASPAMTILPADPSNAGTRPPYDIHLSYKGTPANSEVVFAYYVARYVFWEDGFDALSGGFALTPPATDQVFSMTYNGSSIGTMTVMAADGYCAFELSAPNYITLSPGGVLRITAPSDVDQTMADIHVTLGGYLNQ